MWDIRYRPKKFSDVLGQPGNVKLLKARLKNDTAFDTSYIFLGGHGQGKTTLARIYARAMLCQQLNKEDPEPCNECDNCHTILNDHAGPFTERDAASNGGVDTIRQIVDTLGFAMLNARMRIELFDEAHRMSAAGQDVLLKPLEEKRMVGMFCTTEPEKIRGTIRARCEEYEIRKVTREDLLERMRSVCQQESVEWEDDALLTIIDCSGGHIRDILNKMEMIAQVGAINLSNTREYLHLDAVSLYYEILLALSEPVKALELVNRACERVSPDEILGGLAEAAMNSFRLSGGMYTEFAYVDRALAAKVYDRYRDGTVHLANYFLQNRFPTRAGLLRDILLLTQSNDQRPPDPDRPVSVKIVYGGGAVEGQPFQQATSTPATVSPVTSAPVALPMPSSPGPTKSFTNGLATEVGATMRGIGTQKSTARGRTTNGHAHYAHQDEKQPLAPAEWRLSFEKKWRGSV